MAIRLDPHDLDRLGEAAKAQIRSALESASTSHQEPAGAAKTAGEDVSVHPTANDPSEGLLVRAEPEARSGGGSVAKGMVARILDWFTEPVPAQEGATVRRRGGRTGWKVLAAAGGAVVLVGGLLLATGFHRASRLVVSPQAERMICQVGSQVVIAGSPADCQAWAKAHGGQPVAASSAPAVVSTPAPVSQQPTTRAASSLATGTPAQAARGQATGETPAPPAQGAGAQPPTRPQQQAASPPQQAASRQQQPSGYATVSAPFCYRSPAWYDPFRMACEARLMRGDQVVAYGPIFTGTYDQAYWEAGLFDWQEAGAPRISPAVHAALCREERIPADTNGC
jgi:hypothetical protein